MSRSAAVVQIARIANARFTNTIHGVPASCEKKKPMMTNRVEIPARTKTERRSAIHHAVRTTAI
tara:strand:+ start:1078 stop:1269 length:192 start_codon:yes stop_codon:yes gene_type:complete